MDSQKHALNADSLDWKDVGDEIVVLDLETSDCFSLNSTAAELWRGLAAGSSTTELADRLRETFDVDQPTAEADVAQFVSMMSEAGFVS